LLTPRVHAETVGDQDKAESFRKYEDFAFSAISISKVDGIY
jgi:hypothetical protein